MNQGLEIKQPHSSKPAHAMSRTRRRSPRRIPEAFEKLKTGPQPNKKKNSILFFRKPYGLTSRSCRYPVDVHANAERRPQR